MPNSLGEARQFGELLRREDLRMEHRVDIAALVHGAAERRHVGEIGVLGAAQEDSDCGHAAEHGRARLRLRLLLERSLVPDMGVRIENAGQHHLAARVERLLGRPRQILAEGHDAAPGDGDVCVDLPDARDHQRPVADQQVEPACGPRRSPWLELTKPGIRW